MAEPFPRRAQGNRLAKVLWRAVTGLGYFLRKELVAPKSIAPCYLDQTSSVRLYGSVEALADQPDDRSVAGKILEALDAVEGLSGAPAERVVGVRDGVAQPDRRN
ncbi:MAG: hypothetical protein ACFCUT_01755 [Kiloniellaceae bacterium]